MLFVLYILRNLLTLDQTGFVTVTLIQNSKYFHGSCLPAVGRGDVAVMKHYLLVIDSVMIKQ